MSKTIADTVRVGLIDDHPMVREGVGNVIREIPGAELVFSAASSRDACEYLRRQQIDVLLLDVLLGGEDGFQVIEELLEINPDLRIVMLTVSDNESYVIKAFSRGACGYLLKECDRNQISRTIMAAHAGLAVIGPAKMMSRVFQGWLHTEPASEALGPTLSERELEVLRLVAAGDSNRDIAAKLYLAESTIKKYSHNAMGKLGTTSRGAAAIRAMRLGLIALDGEPG